MGYAKKSDYICVRRKVIFHVTLNKIFKFTSFHIGRKLSGVSKKIIYPVVYIDIDIDIEI